MKIQRGEIYWVDFSPGRGSEPLGVRPALVVQNQAANSSEAVRTLIVATISRSGRAGLPFHIFLEANEENGLPSASYVKCESLYTVDKSRLEGELLGKISDDQLREVDDALAFSLGLNRRSSN